MRSFVFCSFHGEWNQRDSSCPRRLPATKLGAKWRFLTPFILSPRSERACSAALSHNNTLFRDSDSWALLKFRACSCGGSSRAEMCPFQFAVHRLSPSDHGGLSLAKEEDWRPLAAPKAVRFLPRGSDFLPGRPECGTERERKKWSKSVLVATPWETSSSPFVANAT